MKCYKCLHYYVRMVGAGGKGYNPSPCCWLFEDTGRRPNVLTQVCFVSKKKNNQRKKDGEDGKV